MSDENTNQSPIPLADHVLKTFDAARKFNASVNIQDIQQACSDREDLTRKLLQVTAFYEDVFNTGNYIANQYIKRNRLFEEMKEEIGKLKSENELLKKQLEFQR